MYDDLDEEEPNEVPSDEMKFEVRLSEYNIEGFKRDLASQMAERVMREHRDDIKKMARELVAERVAAELEAAIAPIVADALGQPLQPTDAFGKPKGDPVTARDFIAQGAATFLNQCLDPNGRVVTQDSSSMWHKPEYTRLSKMVSGVLDERFKSEMDKAVAEMRRTVQAQMKEAATAWFAEFQKKALAAVTK